MYMNDIKMQMLAKFYGDKYNRRQPPKKVDFIMTYLLELVDRPDSPLLCAGTGALSLSID